jgi:hypothetical protein
MKRIFFFVAEIFVITIFLTACKKDKDNLSSPPLSVTGYWKGVSTGWNNIGVLHLAIINKKNGQSRFYALASSSVDTASNNPDSLFNKFDGNWRLDGNSYFASYPASPPNIVSIYAVGIVTAPSTYIEGYFTFKTNAASQSYFVIVKQP